MADSRRYKDWYSKARTDFSSAEILSAHGGDNSAVAFHCQQSVEKALKGLLLKETDTLFDSHSLTHLCRRASKLNDDYEQFVKDCSYLDQFYIETRYPADDPLEVEDSESRECLEIAKKILETLIVGE